MRRLGAVCAIAVALSTACGMSKTEPTAKRAQSIEAQVWSPYCPGRLLIDCTTHQARELRAEIGERVRDGETSTEILAWVRENYGDEALAEPETSGAGLIIWLGPLAIIAAGAVVLTILLRRWSRTSEPQRQGGSHAGS